MNATELRSPMEAWLKAECTDELLKDDPQRFIAVLSEAIPCPYNDTDADPEVMEDAARALIRKRATKRWMKNPTLTAADYIRRAASVMTEVRRQPHLWTGGTRTNPIRVVPLSSLGGETEEFGAALARLAADRTSETYSGVTTLDALGGLVEGLHTPREREVMSLMLLNNEPMSQSAVALELNLTRGRVSQIVASSYRQLAEVATA